MSELIQIKIERELSKEQKQFNSNIASLTKNKKELTNLNKKLKEGERIIVSEFLPLEEKLIKVEMECLKQFDQNHDMAYFRVNEKEKIKVLLIETLFKLKSKLPDDEYLNKIERKYISEEEANSAKELANDLLGSMFGISDEDYDDDVDTESPFDGFDYINSEKAKKKSKNALEREKKEKERFAKTGKQIYTDLVKKLHPDKESDEELKKQKTELMKEVTNAYEKKDYYSLLLLHKKHMDEEKQRPIDTMADDQLKYYNKLLRTQISEIRREIEMLKYSPDTGRIYNLMKGSKAQKRKKVDYEKERFYMELEGQESILSIAKKKGDFRKYIKHIDVEYENNQMMNMLFGEDDELDFPFPF